MGGPRGAGCGGGRFGGVVFDESFKTLSGGA
jgi:hypothetical protein